MQNLPILLDVLRITTKYLSQKIRPLEKEILMRYIPDVGLSPLGLSGRGLKLATHLHLAPRLRMLGAILALPQYIFAAY
jgi:hypothetical protein